MLSLTENLRKRQHPVNSVEVPPRTGAGDALSELVVHVFRLDGLLKNAGDALAEPVGQSTARWRVLAALEDGPMTVAQIARAWWLARQSVQRVADLLERDGLLAYETNPAHRRAQLVRLTRHGRSTLLRIRAAQSDWANTVGDQIGENDLQTANRILARVVETLADAGR
jgi:DNA-binding MarR family transcriptional regulator